MKRVVWSAWPLRYAVSALHALFQESVNAPPPAWSLELRIPAATETLATKGVETELARTTK